MYTTRYLSLVRVFPSDYKNTCEDKDTDFTRRLVCWCHSDVIRLFLISETKRVNEVKLSSPAWFIRDVVGTRNIAATRSCLVCLESSMDQYINSVIKTSDSSHLFVMSLCPVSTQLKPHWNRTKLLIWTKTPLKRWNHGMWPSSRCPDVRTTETNVPHIFLCGWSRT